MCNLYFVSVSMASLCSTKINVCDRCNIQCIMQYTMHYAIYNALCNIQCIMQYTMHYAICLCLLCVGKPTPEGSGGEARESKEGEGKESG